MKKVAIVYRMDQHGGVQSCVISLARGLNRIGIVPDLVWDVEPDWQMLKDERVEVNFQKINFGIPTLLIDKLPPTLRYVSRWFCLVNEEDLGREYDFVYAFYNGLLLQKTPHVYFLSGPPLLPQLDKGGTGLRHIPYLLAKCLYRNLVFRLSPVYEYHRQSPCFINSQFTAHLFREAHGVDLPVVYPPIAVSGHTFLYEDLPRRDTITFYSRIVDYKRPEMLFELAQRYPQFRTLIMGGVSANRQRYFLNLKKHAASLGLLNVEFLANPSSAHVRRELQRTRFYVFPAQNEHFGMTTPEVIALGVIPFVHDSGGQPEIVNNPALRFVDETFLEKFGFLASASFEILNKYRQGLLRNIKQFSEEHFVDKMLSCMV